MVSAYKFIAALKQHHLKYVYQDTFSARAKWYNIGICLSLTSYTLDAIAKDFHRCEEQHRESLKTWLKRDRPIATMLQLIDALRNATVDESQLAHELETKYSRRKESTNGKTCSRQ